MTDNVETAAEQQAGADDCDVTIDAGGFGKIRVELYWEHAPNTCKNFYELAKRGAETRHSQYVSNLHHLGYYDGVVFHRIIPVRSKCTFFRRSMCPYRRHPRRTL